MIEFWGWFAIGYMTIGIVITFSLFGYPPRGKMSELAPYMVFGYPFFAMLLLYAWWINRPKRYRGPIVPLKAIRIKKRS